MRKIPTLLLILLCAFHFESAAQVSLSGQSAVHFFKSGHTDSPRAMNNGRPTFAWRTDLFIDGSVSENVAALCNVRVLDDEYVNFDYLAIRLTNLTPLNLNLQVGKFDMPFGNLAERRFPRRNPLFGLPLIYEYRTSLPSQLTSSRLTSEAELLGNRGRGKGMRLLDLGIYDIGAMVFGSYDILSYAFAVTSGTVSATSYSYQNTNSDLGKIVRLAVTPTAGLTLGGAFAWGAYLDEPYQFPGRALDVNEYVQKTGEVDLEFSRGHAVVYGEVVFSSWSFPMDQRDEDFGLFGYYAEGKYTLMPRLFVALRMSGLRFGSATLAQVSQPWDYNVTEWEGGVGFFLDRNVVLKLVRRETRTYGGTRPKDNLAVLQLAVEY